jgi:hypothetical protein
MKQQMIVQFVGFATSMNTEEFTPEWENYTGKFKNSKTTVILYKEKIKNKKAFDYISKIEWPQGDFNSALANDQKAGRFSEQKARAVQMGGYISIEEKNSFADTDNDTVIIAMIGHNENDIGFYEGLPLYSQVNIYQAYYENCRYGYVAEFTVPEADAEMLLQHLAQRPGVEASLYRTCLQPQL